MNFLQSYELCMDVKTREHLSFAVKKARGSRSQRKFAKDIGVSFAAVRSWEECESFPSQENLSLIASVLGLPLDEFLLYLNGEPYPKPRYEKAEDLLPIVSELSDSEAARLIEIIVSRWRTDGEKT